MVQDLSNMFTPVFVHLCHRLSQSPFYSGWFMATRFVLVCLYVLGGLGYLAALKVSKNGNGTMASGLFPYTYPQNQKAWSMGYGYEETSGCIYFSEN
jgi:hypothetical protein